MTNDLDTPIGNGEYSKMTVFVLLNGKTLGFDDS